MKLSSKLFQVLLLILWSCSSVGQDQEKQNVQEKLKDVVYYSDYGAAGDGVKDDFDAIINAHKAANAKGLKVMADPGATYYLSGADKTVEVQTDTDWGNAKFIIDDRNVVNRSKNIFNISSKLSSINLTGKINTLTKEQSKITAFLPQRSVILVEDNSTKVYIRYGSNQNNGTAQTDVFLVDQSGLIDKSVPINWNYKNISSIVACPIDEKPLTIKGGYFTTIANQAESVYNYYSRGIRIGRSNVIVENIHHTVTGEGATGSPYGGFLSISNCANINVQDCQLSGHKAYKHSSIPVTMGSYDLEVSRAVNVTVRNCKQLNDINDRSLWGIFASNNSKNISFDNIEFSRFDAHMGATNVTIKNSKLGQQGLRATGFGLLLIENTSIYADRFVSLREDYGSTWNGDIIIRNCSFLPRNGMPISSLYLIDGSNKGQHDFGYPCFMPTKITIDGLTVDDTNMSSSYKSGVPYIFGTFNPNYTGNEPYPYTVTKTVEIKNLIFKSGKKYSVSPNANMFKSTKIVIKGD